MIYHVFHDRYIKSRVFEGNTVSDITPLQLYNEIKFNYLNNLDYRGNLVNTSTLHDKITVFPTLAHSTSVNTLDLDPINDRFLLSGSSDSSIKLWDLKNENESDTYKPLVTLPRKSVHNFGITNIRWWPDNGMCLSSSYDFNLNLYDASRMEVAHTFKLGSRVLHFDFFNKCNSNSLVACCLDGGTGGVKLIDLKTLSDTHILGGGGKSTGGVGYMSACAWSPLNPNLCIGGGIDGTCYGWDIRSSKKFLFQLDSNTTEFNIKRRKLNSPMKKNRTTILKPKAHNGRINSILFTENGKEMITCGLDEKIHVWNMYSLKSNDKAPINKGLNLGSTLRNKTNQNIKMCLSPSTETESQFLWVPSENGELLVYRLEDGCLVARLSRSSRNKKEQRSYSIVCSRRNTNRYYTGCKDGNISIWGYDKRLQRDTRSVHFDNGIDIPEESEEENENEEYNT